jgi:hypothetical protein
MKSLLLTKGLKKMKRVVTIDNSNNNKNTIVQGLARSKSPINTNFLHINNLNKKPINKNENNNIDNNDNNDEETKPYNMFKIREIKEKLKENVKTICNVFQPVYKNENTTGLGDFVRGSYFLLQFCEENGFQCEFKISNHRIKFLLQNFEKSPDLQTHISSKVARSNIINHMPIVDSFNTIYNNNDYNANDDFIFFLENYPIFDNFIYIHLITYPNFSITQNQKERIKFILEPNDLMINKINNALIKLKLTKYSYEIIHIRFGDEYIVDKDLSINKQKYNNICNYLDYILLNKTKRYLLITDNNILKKILVSKYNFLFTIFNKISHTKDNDNDINELENTMLEFYLMSYSTNIACFSTYKHGSGFSKWCAETYDIPYICKFIE